MRKILLFTALIVLVLSALLIIPVGQTKEGGNPLPFNLNCPLITEIMPQNLNLALVEHLPFLSAKMPTTFTCTARKIVVSESCKNKSILVENNKNLFLQIGENNYTPTNLDHTPVTYVYNLPYERPDIAAWFLYEALRCHNVNAAYDLANLANLAKAGEFSLPDDTLPSDLYRFVAISYLRISKGVQECRQKYQDILDKKYLAFEIKTPSHQEQIKWAQSLCGKSDAELLSIAKSYLDESDPEWHAVIAYQILTQIRAKDDAVWDKILKAKNTAWPELQP